MPISTGVSDLAVCADPSFIDDDIRPAKHLDSALSERIHSSRDAYLASGRGDDIASAKGIHLESPVWDSLIATPRGTGGTAIRSNSDLLIEHRDGNARFISVKVTTISSREKQQHSVR
jgi:hypothetical protein